MPYGTAFWAPLSGTSWARTRTGCPARCHSCPAAAYSPSTSFVLVSTQGTGCPAAVNSLTRPPVYRNCASRSTVAGALGPPRGALQGEPLGGEQRGQRVRAHRVPLPGQLGGQLPGDVHRPAQRGLRVPTLIRLDQRQQGRDQARIALAQPLAARTHRPHPVGRLTAQLARTARHRRLRHPRNTRHPAHTPIPQAAPNARRRCRSSRWGSSAANASPSTTSVCFVTPRSYGPTTPSDP